MEHKRLFGRVLVSRQMRSELCPFNAGKWALHLGHLFGVPGVLVSLPLPLFTHKQTGTKTGVALVNTLLSHRLTGAWERKKDTPTLSILQILNWGIGSLSVYENEFELNWPHSQEVELELKEGDFLICTFDIFNWILNGAQTWFEYFIWLTSVLDVDVRKRC